MLVLVLGVRLVLALLLPEAFVVTPGIGLLPLGCLRPCTRVLLVQLLLLVLMLVLLSHRLAQHIEPHTALPAARPRVRSLAGSHCFLLVCCYCKGTRLR
jgi:hypothetical protein